MPSLPVSLPRLPALGQAHWAPHAFLAVAALGTFGTALANVILASAGGALCLAGAWLLRRATTTPVPSPSLWRTP